MRNKRMGSFRVLGAIIKHETDLRTNETGMTVKGEE